MSLYQLSVPPQLMGRVFSVRLLIVRITMPIGVWVGGEFGGQVGIRQLFIGMGASIVAASLLGVLIPVFRTIQPICPHPHRDQNH